VISISLVGLQETLAAVQRLPTSIERAPAFEEAAQTFSARLRAATPPGYSGKLRDSVIYEAGDEESLVGYEEGVETAGNPKLDSVREVRTRGGSVISRKKWVQSSDLESVLQETFDSFSDEAVEVLEKRLSRGIS
jgi:hypothetical protein